MVINVSSILSRSLALKLSLTSFLFLPLERLFLVQSWGWAELVCMSLFVATMELLFKRLPGESVKIFTVAEILFLFVPIIFCAFDVPSIAACIVLYMVLIACCAYLWFMKLSQLRPLFKQQSVMATIESQTRLLYGALVGLIMMLFVCARGSLPVYLLVLALLLPLYIFLFVRTIQNRSIILKKYKEIMLEQLVHGNLKPYSSKESAQDLPKMSALYQKVVLLVEEKEPFLDPDYGIHDMARDVFTNKTYLSQTINVVSGRNFRQFINYYRVRHAIKLMTDNPKLTVEELSRNSGFHSTVTFNMAFKLNVGDTPGEYCQKLKARVNRKSLP